MVFWKSWIKLLWLFLLIFHHYFIVILLISTSLRHYIVILAMWCRALSCNLLIRDIFSYKGHIILSRTITSISILFIRREKALGRVFCSLSQHSLATIRIISRKTGLESTTRMFPSECVCFWCLTSSRSLELGTCKDMMYFFNISEITLPLTSNLQNKALVALCGRICSYRSQFWSAFPSYLLRSSDVWVRSSLSQSWVV